jgi:thioredoxin reductase
MSGEGEGSIASMISSDAWDVIILGSGVAGLAAALAAHELGLRPLVLEKASRLGQPYSTGGVYVNYLGREADEGTERIKAAYGPEKYQRLLALKNKYDPTNLFRLNQNIRPVA